MLGSFPEPPAAAPDCKLLNTMPGSMEAMYMLLVAVDMQLKLTAILIPRDARAEGSAMFEHQNKGQNCVPRRQKHDQARFVPLGSENFPQNLDVLMFYGSCEVSSNSKFYAGRICTWRDDSLKLLPSTIIFWICRRH